jgi:hypothetical protein
MIITRAISHQNPRGGSPSLLQLRASQPSLCRSPATGREAVPPHFVSPSGKFLALTVKKPAGRTPSVETCSGPDQRRRWTAEAVDSGGGGSHAG